MSQNSLQHNMLLLQVSLAVWYEVVNLYHSFLFKSYRHFQSGSYWFLTGASFAFAENFSMNLILLYCISKDITWRFSHSPKWSYWLVWISINLCNYYLSGHLRSQVYFVMLLLLNKLKKTQLWQNSLKSLYLINAEYTQESS